MTSKNWLEWSVFSISAVVLAFVFGYLAYDAYVSEGDPARIEIELGTVEVHDGYYALPVTFHNYGGQSVEDVAVDITLIREQMEDETVSVTAPILPRESSRNAWVAFSSNPADADEIRTQVVSYVAP